MSFRIDYVGATWCKVCTIVKPGIEQIAKNFSVPLNILDIDEMPESDHIKKVPTVLIYKDTELVHTIVTKHIDTLRAYMIEHVGERSVELADDF